MDKPDVAVQLQMINERLDVVLEEIELQRRHRREIEDLKEDLLRIGKDVYGTAVEELDEIHDYIQTGDVLYLFKKLLRNIRTITEMFETLENTRDFLQDFAPISREMAIDFMHKLDEYDRKRYFEFIKELGKAADRVVTAFTAEDVRKLSDNIVTILMTVKNLTQPDILQVVNNALAVYKNLEIGAEKDVSLVSLVRELRSPEMKRGLAFAIRFLKSVSSQRENGNALDLSKHQTN